MSKLKSFLSGQVLLIVVLAGVLTFMDAKTDLKLGLDLKGGTQLDYSIDLSKVDPADQEQIVEGVKEVIRRRVDGLGVSEPSIYLSNIADEFHVIVELAGIEDMDEAKATVGKTIQLEFREENPNPDDSVQKQWASDSGSSFLSRINAGEDFEKVAKEFEKQKSDSTNFEVIELIDQDTLPSTLAAAAEGLSVGETFGPFEFEDGYRVDGSGVAVPNKGIAVIKLTDRTTQDETENIEAKVSARHILIAYQGSERADASITRSKEEALASIQELKTKLNEGGSFEDLATEYTDDPSGKVKEGDLGSFAKGAMTQAFEDAAFALEPGQVSDIVETEFGYHLIQVYDKQAATTEMKTVTMVAMNKIVFSITPDPWIEAPALTGEHFKHADVVFNQATRPLVTINFTDEGAKLFEDLTDKHVGKRIAIFVGGTMISAPTVNERIAGGQAQITGDFTLEEAQELARDLNTGAIPAPVELVGQYNISATLGQEALDQSMFAGLLGIVILALFMIAYYRLPGLIAILALGIYSLLLIFIIKVSMSTALALLLSLGIFAYIVHMILKGRDSTGEKFIAFLVASFVLFFMAMVFSTQITLTLAGIAGVILSIGMAVDANVLIFERMKEELREGRTLSQAMDEGFKRAWDSIRDSNFSSLITCAILFYFGSSIIRGFALNLALGILLSMFSAIMLTRTLMNFAISTKLADKIWLWGKPKGPALKIKIIEKGKIWMAISGIAVLLSLVAIPVFGVNYGLDFTGGAMMELKFTGETAQSSDSLQAGLLAVEESIGGDFGNPQIVETDQGTFLIRMKDISEEEHNAILAKLSENQDSIEELRFTTVGPTIGSTLKQKAGIALAFAAIMIVLYIAFAFRKVTREISSWKFGAAAIVALLHDVLITFGVFILLGHFMNVEIDALFVTAILTVMGFSVHDTIVVFDRIRENLRFRSSGESLTDIANKALNQTMARSLNTSMSTMITILALFLFGAESIHWFVFALLIGIFVGTYSSVFIASPILVMWENWSEKRSR